MRFWELLFFIVLLTAGGLPLLRVRSGLRLWAAAALLIACLCAVPLLIARIPDETAIPRGAFAADTQVPAFEEGREYVSSVTCRSCHPSSYESWHHSFHRTMTQVAKPQNVIAPFDNVRLRSRGRDYHLEREGDTFWVTMPDPEQESWLKHEQGVDLDAMSDAEIRSLMVKRQIVMTTGSHHMQTYWIRSPGPGNHLRQVPWYFLQDDQRWVPREDIALMPPDLERSFPLWNASCIACHSVGGRPGIDSRTGTLESTVAELGISCEACHGPAEAHVRHHRSPLNRYLQRQSDDPDPTIVNPAKCSSMVSSQICGQCHSYYQFKDFQQILARGQSYRPGDDLTRTRKIVMFDTPEHQKLEAEGKAVCWQDGTCRTGGDEYNGMTVSTCFTKGRLSCLSCHSMHSSEPSDQLAADMDTDRACLQCHTSYADNPAAHTHHAASSSGSRCYNCHMPHTSFALLTAMRSHRIDSPHAAISAASGRPNACNLCHLNRTLQWTAEKLNVWYDQKMPDLTKDEQTVAASVLGMLRGDAVQRVISAWHAGWPAALDASGDTWQAPILTRLLEDPYSVVRYTAARSLLRQPGFGEFAYDYVAPVADRSDAVRRAEFILKNQPRKAGSPETLQTPDGRTLDDELRRLLQQRDDRPMWVLE